LEIRQLDTSHHDWIESDACEQQWAKIGFRVYKGFDVVEESMMMIIVYLVLQQ